MTHVKSGSGNGVTDVSGRNSEAQLESDLTYFRQRLALTCVYMWRTGQRGSCVRTCVSQVQVRAQGCELYFPNLIWQRFETPWRETHTLISPVSRLSCALVPHPHRVLFRPDTPYLQPEFRPAGNESHAAEITWWSQMSCSAGLLPIMLLIEFK